MEETSTEPVLVSQTAGVCEIRLNRPTKRNAITLAMYDVMWDAIVRGEADDTVRVILLSGGGPSFTAGNDLMDFVSAPAPGDKHGAVKFIRLLPKIHKVLIAAVHGSTVGIGVTLLLH